MGLYDSLFIFNEQFFLKKKIINKINKRNMIPKKDWLPEERRIFANIKNAETIARLKSKNIKILTTILEKSYKENRVFIIAKLLG